MFAICIEASHAKGMGHLFRMLNFAEYLEKQKQDFIFIINDDKKTQEILKSKNYNYNTQDLKDIKSGWEIELIQNHKLQYWIDDRLDTDEMHSKNIIAKKVKLISFDNLGSGAKHSDINVCGLFFNKKNLEGKNILKGSEYLILNSEIDNYKKMRTELKNIIVTLGGSDTHGVTLKILALLKRYNIKADIHIGPSFAHLKEMEEELNEDYRVINYVPSLIEKFSKYDLAITGGGITPFEANASGLPCLIVANEPHEIENAKLLESFGASRFLGYHENIDETILSTLKDIDIQMMSRCAMDHLDTMACEKIYKEIIRL